MTTQKNATKINLVESWITAETSCSGFEKRDALKDLNEALDKNYDMNRLNKWQRGDEAVPQPVQDYMLQRAIKHVFHSCGIDTTDITNEQYARIVQMLTPPVRN